MGKTLIINMSNIKLEGDILDVSGDNTGIIYNISKDVDDEICVDYVNSENSKEIQHKYDACTIFFKLSNLWSNKSRELLIKEVTSYVKKDGKVYIWDLNKERGKIIDNKVRVLLPNGKDKETSFKNYNPLTTCKFDEVKKKLEKYCEIEETKVWENIFFLQGRIK